MRLHGRILVAVLALSSTSSNQIQVTRAAPAAPRLAAAMNISAANIGIAAGSPLGAWALSTGGHATLGQTGMALAALALGMAFYCARPLRPLALQVPSQISLNDYILDRYWTI